MISLVIPIGAKDGAKSGEVAVDGTPVKGVIVGELTALVMVSEDEAEAKPAAPAAPVTVTPATTTTTPPPAPAPKV
ncbi:MAG TPA: hypothetical protein VFV58_39455 [Blastocatellia bacterium]|nr:hypothetical protein [Blastocatellia bacterium]